MNTSPPTYSSQKAISPLTLLASAVFQDCSACNESQKLPLTVKSEAPFFVRPASSSHFPRQTDQVVSRGFLHYISGFFCYIISCVRSEAMSYFSLAQWILVWCKVMLKLILE